MDRTEIGRLLTGLELCLVVIGSDFNAQLDKESVEAALRSAQGIGSRAQSRTAACAKAWTEMAVARAATAATSPTRRGRRAEARWSTIEHIAVGTGGDHSSEAEAPQVHWDRSSQLSASMGPSHAKSECAAQPPPRQPEILWPASALSPSGLIARRPPW